MMERNVDIDFKTLTTIRSSAIETLQMSVEEARAFVNGEEIDMDDLDTCIDMAQGEVFTDVVPVAYVIIKIVK